MTFQSLPTLVQDQALTEEYFGRIKGNFDDLDARVSQINLAVVPNGSFESFDPAAPYHPVGWTWTPYAGGTGGTESGQAAHGARNVYVTAPGGAGNGGGYYDSDYIACSDLRVVAVAALYRASVATMHNRISVYWYDATKVLLGGSIVYDVSAASPSVWTRVEGYGMPVAGTRYVRIRIEGGVPDSAAGTARYDQIELRQIDGIVGSIPEQIEAYDYQEWRDQPATLSIRFSAPAGVLVTLRFTAELRCVQPGAEAGMRFRVGACYSNEFRTTATTYTRAGFVLSVLSSGPGSTETLVMQLCNFVFPYDSAGRMESSLITVSWDH